MIYHPEAINAPNNPAMVGDIVVFESPVKRGVLLADIAEYDRYGRLVWSSLQHDDQRAVEAIREFNRINR